MQNKFNIGDYGWVVDFSEHTEKYMECPECGGTGRVRIMFHDDSIASVECGGCDNHDLLGRQPSGRVRYYETATNVKKVMITGISIQGNKVEYQSAINSCSWYTYKEQDIFETEEEAKDQAIIKVAQYNQEQLANVSKKHKENKTWSWNASYHKSCIKRAQKDIDYHTAKLQVANLKAKDKTNG